MGGAAFRTALVALNLDVPAFARVLIALGDVRPERTVVRQVQAWARDELEVPESVRCLVELMRLCPAWKNV